MSRFKKLGMITYDKKELYVHNTLLDFVRGG